MDDLESLKCGTGGRVFHVDNRNDPHPTGEIEDVFVEGGSLPQGGWSRNLANHAVAFDCIASV
jgi:hypothetical protein